MKSNQKSHMADVCPLQSERSCDPEGDNMDDTEGRNSAMNDIDQHLSRWDDIEWIDCCNAYLSWIGVSNDGEWKLASERTARERDPSIILHLCLEYAEQRKLNAALYHAKQLVELEAGSSIRGYILLARILSAQKQFVEAEIVIDAALDQCGKWNQGELLRTKAKLRIAQGHLKSAVKTYTLLLAVLQIQAKSSGSTNKYLKSKGNRDRSLEMEIWHDLASIYTTLSQWRDAEVCLSKSQAIHPYSASRFHSTGLLHEARGLHQEAQKSFRKALDIDPNHVASLISTACVLMQLGGQSSPIARSLLTDALRLDRTNPSAWYKLGLLYKADAGASAWEAAECFEGAAILEESSPIEPFR
ncbi:hypothetical protein L6164_025890 [Bauhinia variegata]|uniref:Uncharacterized protein n=1 Tax=Bauhinia variegata TaxID=167791 RepID=A0ACB9M1X5_BAUVA|nr:hypothetical protein L6164_025890 [Bauhinia variegata]